MDLSRSSCGVFDKKLEQYLVFLRTGRCTLTKSCLLTDSNSWNQFSSVREFITLLYVSNDGCDKGFADFRRSSIQFSNLIRMDDHSVLCRIPKVRSFLEACPCSVILLCAFLFAATFFRLSQGSLVLCSLRKQIVLLLFPVYPEDGVDIS